MADLKNSWKNTGAGLGHAFRDLGKTIIVSGKEPAQQASPAKFTADEIRKLAQLRDEGLITDEEFIAKKKQLLGI